MVRTLIVSCFFSLVFFVSFTIGGFSVSQCDFGCLVFRWIFAEVSVVNARPLNTELEALIEDELDVQNQMLRRTGCVLCKL